MFWEYGAPVQAPVLYQLPPMCGLMSLSPFCVKVQLTFQLKRVPYTLVNTLFARMNPRRKVPYVVWGDRRIEDSTAIATAIDEAGEGPTLYPVDPAQRSEAHILEDWADESLYWHGVMAKFHDPEGWIRLAPGFRASAPVLLRPFILGPARRQTLAKLSAQGLTRRAPELARAEFQSHLDALEARLDGRTWLVGDSISVADVAVNAMLAQLHEGLCPWYAREIAARPKVTALLANVQQEAKRRASG